MKFSCPKEGPSRRIDVPPPPPKYEAEPLTRNDLKKGLEALATGLNDAVATDGTLTVNGMSEWTSLISDGLELVPRGRLVEVLQGLARQLNYAVPAIDPEKRRVQVRIEYWDEEGEDGTEEEKDDNGNSRQVHLRHLVCPICGTEDDIVEGGYTWMWRECDIEDDEEQDEDSVQINFDELEWGDSMEVRSGLACNDCGAEELLPPQSPKTGNDYEWNY